MRFKSLERVHNLKQDIRYLWDVIDVLRKEIKELKQENMSLFDELHDYKYKDNS